MTATFTATFTAAGTYTWVAPAGVSSVDVRCVGGGAGGSSASTGTTTPGGGGGGEDAEETALAVTAGNSYTVTVGAGGAGGTSIGGSSVNGSSSSFPGDSVTVTANGGTRGTTGGGGAGGTGSSNTVHHNGGAGGTGFTSGSLSAGGGGGSSAGSAAAGNAGGAATSNAAPGAGGTAPTGGGAGGGGAYNGNATSGSAPGGGGGGAGYHGTQYNAGNGIDGQVVITWTMASPAALAANTAGGTYQWIAPAATTKVSSECWGSGAGGFQTGTSGGAGGGGGEYAAELSNTCVAGDAYTFAVGAGGASKAGGSSSTFSGTSATTVTAHGGSVSAADNTGGLGGTGSANTVHHDGGAGGHDGTTGGGGGGGSGGSAAAGNAGTSGSTTSGGAGAAAVTGGGPGGAGGNATVAGSKPASGPGGGGGGAGYTSTTNGAGYDGQIVLTWGPVTSTGSVALPRMALAGTSTVTATSSGSVALPRMGLSATAVAAAPFPAQPLGSKVELLLNGTWTDISSYVYQRDLIAITRGRPDESQTVTAATLAMTLDNRLGDFTPKNSSGAYYPYLTRNIQIRVSVIAASSSGVVYSGYRFWGEVSAWPPSWDPSGTDVYSSITAAGLLRRLNQGSKIGSAIYRYLLRLTGDNAPLAYWPCEDGAQATQFASAIPGGAAMTWTGTPTLSTDTSFGGSDALPQISGSAWTGAGGSFSAGGADTFTTPGSVPWVAPGGISSLTSVECWGGGGGGGNGVTGNGGAGGEYAKETSVAVTPGNSYTVVVGAGGAYGSYDNDGEGGSDGASSAFPGDSVTVTAHGGEGGTQSGYSNAGGGTGSANTTHYDGGDGGSGVSNSYNGGAGGGGSGGSASAGNDGDDADSNTGRPGGAAVTGGGAGGSGGSGGSGSEHHGNSGDIPGGGGGAGGFNTTSKYGGQGGTGASGQVKLTYTPSTTPYANVLRFLLDIPTAGGVNASIYGRMTTSGTVAKVDVKYGTGGTLQVIGYNSGGSALFTSTAAGSYNGSHLIVSVELTPSGTSVAWALNTVLPGLFSSKITLASGTIASASIGGVTDVYANPGGTETGAIGAGHYIVQGLVTSLVDLAAAASGYSSERAGTRFTRLCGEEGITGTLFGNASDTPLMGPQPDDLLVNVLQQVEDIDRGQLSELRGAFGLGYRTRVNMQNQTAVLTLDYSAAELAGTLQPTYDDLMTRNDITVSRTSGSSAHAEDDSSAMSVLDPPNGVGRYTYSLTVNADADSQLANEAAWLLTLGTVDEERYPVVMVDLSRSEVASLFATVPAMDVGDFFQISNPPAWLPSGTIAQLAYGFSESFGPFGIWAISVNAVPESPYTGAGLPTW